MTSNLRKFKDFLRVALEFFKVPKLKKGIKSGSFVLTILHKSQNETLGNVERKKRIKWAFKPAKKLQKNIDKAFL